MNVSENKIFNMDCIEGMKTLPDESVNCCVTSPPYYGLRDYGTEGQAGLEATPELYVAKMVDVFEQVRRVLKKDGTLWLNLGDSYNGYPGNVTQGGKLSGQNQHARHGKPSGYGLTDKRLKQKDLIGIPWMVAFALRSAGWHLRQDIIWSKPNPMPESVTDRCTKSHEYIFLLSKSAKYYYDHEAIKQIMADSSVGRLNQDLENQQGSDRVPGKTNGKMKAVGKTWEQRKAEGAPMRRGLNPEAIGYGNFYSEKANKRSVWTVTTVPYAEAHFATFPEKLITDCIKAGCPAGGLVLDPFMGAGTTALVARKLNRNFIGFELNPEYIRIAETRLKKELGMFI